MDLYNAILNELEKRKITHVKEFAPFYISSIGTHIFNIVNQKKNIWTSSAGTVNTRQHILMVTVPGFGKSFMLKQFLDKEIYSIVKGTAVPASFEQNFTEAGLIGSISRGPGGEIQTHYGLAYKKGNNIIGVEEFSTVTNAMKQDYNMNLDTSMLTLLDSGDVIKSMSAGSIEYKTNLTMWAGVQPGRYNLSSGLGRRFVFLVFVPTWEDILAFRKASREADGIVVDQLRLTQLKKAIDIRVAEINNQLTEIEFNMDFYKEMDRLNVMHYEEMIYKRLALGYWLMKVSYPNGKLIIGVDTELKRIINLEHGFRKRIKKGTDLDQVRAVVKGRKEVAFEDLISLLLDFSMDEQMARNLIATLIAFKEIKIEERTDGKWVIPVGRNSFKEYKTGITP